MRKRSSLGTLLFTVLILTTSCVPHATTVEPALLEEEKKGGITVSNVTLNEEGNNVTVKPGSIIRGTLDYQVWTAAECPSCIAQIVVGVGDAVQDCIYFGFPGTYPGASGKGEIRFTAPVVEGSYDVRYKRIKAYTCEHAKSLYAASPPSSSNTIATVVVGFSLPKKEEKEEPRISDTEFEEMPKETMTAKVYFSNRKRARGKRCSAVFPVRRKAPKSLAVATAAMKQLFQGTTEEERSQGYSSHFSKKTADLLRRITIQNKTAYVDLNDFRTILSDVNNACRRTQFLSQMTRTVTRFRTVKKAVFAIEGDPEAFYVFLKVPCDERCDPAPFEEQ